MSGSPSVDDIAVLDLNTGGGYERGSTAVEAEPVSDPGGGEKGGGEFMVETLEESREGFLDTGDGDSARKLEMDVEEEGDAAGSEEASDAVVPEGAEVGESSSGTGVEHLEEKVAAYVKKGPGDMANEVTERDLVDRCFQATEVGNLGSRGRETGDGRSGDQELRADAPETGNMVGMAVEEAKDERLESMADLGGNKEVVVEIRNGTKPMKEDEYFPEKKASAMSDQRSGPLVDEQAQVIESNSGPSELVAGDELGGDQKLELNVKVAGSMMVAAEAATVGTVGPVEVDGLEGKAANDGEKVDVMETGNKTEPLVEQSTANDVMGHDILDEQLQAEDPKCLEMEDGLGTEQKSEINVMDGTCVVECGKGNELVKEQITNQNLDCEVRDQDLVDEHLQPPEKDVGSIALEAENELGGHEMLEANVGNAGFGVGTVKTQAHVALVRVEADSSEGIADLGLMHVGAAEVRKIELTEEGICCPQKDKSVVGEVVDLQAAQGAFGPVLGTEKFVDGDQKLEDDVLELGCPKGAAKTQAAADLGGEEAERLKSISDLGRVQHKVSETSGTELTRQDVSCPLKNQSLVTEKGGRGLADANLQVSEGDGSQNKLVVVESTSGTKDMDEGVEGSLMSSDQDRIHEASVSQTYYMDTNQNDQEIGNAIHVEETKEVDSMPVHDAIIEQADYAIKDPDMADPGVKVSNPDSSHAHDDTVDGGHILTAESKAGLVNSVVHAEALSADKHPTYEDVRDKDIITADGGSVLDVTFMESESRGTQLVDENTSDKEDITMANSCSDLESQFAEMGPLGSQTAETCPLGEKLEKLMHRKVSVLKDSKLAVATGLPMASELSEIQTVVSQRKEIVECIPGRNQETEPQSIGLLVGRSDVAIVHEAESLPGICQNMDMESSILKDETSLPEVCHEKGDLAHDSEADKKTSVLVDSGANIVTGRDGTEQNVQVGEQEHPKIAHKQIVKRFGIRPGICSIENDQHASYFLPLQDNDTFSISDLVWGKVKSHPWWPGQIFDPSEASDLAMKYQKKDNFLVAYFGDKTFAWCEEPHLKPFETYFSQMEKQSSSDAFVNAVNDALGEVSRRTELGMTCFCLPEGAYADIKYQMVENAGIRDTVSSSAFDRSLVVDYFQPDRLLEYIEALAQLPSGGANRLELVIAQAQLKVFYRSKGYPELPVFQIGGGLMENDAEVSPSDSKLVGEDTIEHSTPTPMELILGRRKRGRGRPSNKEKQMLEDAKKQRNLSEVMEKSVVSPLANGGKIGFAVKVDGDSISLSSEKKRRVIDVDSDYSEKSKKKRLDSLGDLSTKSPSLTPSSSFKVGECIRRVASQLTGSPSILRCHSETFQKGVSKDVDRRFDVDSETSAHTAVKNPGVKVGMSEDCSSADEMLLQLCLAARHPMKGYSFLSMIVSFFTDFRNFCVSSSSMEKKHVQKIGGKRGRKRTVSSRSPSSDMSTPDHMQDSFWSDMIDHNSSANDLKRKGDANMRSQRRRRKSGGETSIFLSLDRVLGPAQHLQVGTISPKMKQALTTERSVISLEEKIVDECTPTALILSFNGSSSLPSEMDLIRIFSRYGPLKEAETEVQRKTNHVKVVFKKRADAEIAFRSAGKYSIFGPALVSYRLKYLPSTPSSSPNTTPQGKNDAGSIEGGKLVVPGAASPNAITGKQDAVPIEGGNSEVPGDASPNTTPQMKNDAVFIEGGNLLEVSGDVSPNTTPQDKNGAVPTEGGNLGFPGSSAPNVIPYNENDAVQIEGGNIEVPGSTSADSTQQDKNDAVSAEGGNLEVPDDIYPNTTREKNNSASIEDGSLEVPGITCPNNTTQDKYDAAPIEYGSLEVPCNTSPSTAAQGKNDAAPTDDGSLEIPGNGYANDATQDKSDAVPTEGANLEVPDKAEKGVVPDTMQDEVGDEGSVDGVVQVDNQSG